MLFRHGMAGLAAKAAVGGGVTFVGATSGEAAGAQNLAWPASHAADDVAFLIHRVRANDTTPTVPTGFTDLTDTTESSGGTSSHTRISAFWARATGGAESDVSLSDFGQVNIVGMVVFRGLKTTGDPWLQFTSSNGSSADPAPTAGTTTNNDARVLILVGTNHDSATSILTSITNGDLTDIQERLEYVTDTLAGGAIILGDGLKSTAGSVGTFTVDTTATCNWAALCLELVPA